MRSYETGRLTFNQAAAFTRQFDARVGTEREWTKLSDDSYWICCFELTPEEVAMCRNIEAASLLGEKAEGSTTMTALVRNIDRNMWLEFRWVCLGKGISANEGIKRLVYEAVAREKGEK